MGIIMLIGLTAVELFFLVWAIESKTSHSLEKSIVRIAELVLLGILLSSGILEWSFRYYMILAVLSIQAIVNMITLIKRADRPYRLGKGVIGFIRNGLLYAVVLAPAIIFPQYTQPAVTGSYEVETAIYTWVDENRLETLSETCGNRALTVEFWYPENIDGKVPLAVFSHGAFGFRGSNHSTFVELASNGYVVCSIDHTYHSFFTKQADGKTIIGSFDFINDAIGAQSNDRLVDSKTSYDMTHERLALRVDDMNFVLNTILQEVGRNNDDSVFNRIDTDKIGLFGHSLGGATAAQVGRIRSDVDAVIVVDGTMIGERVDFKDGKPVLTHEKYPVPILNIYNQEHYDEAMKEKETYANMVASANAVKSFDLVVKKSGHLNFTDLPLFSPVLAGMLGTGEVDSRYCIETMNQVVLEFFNCYLKNGEQPNFKKEY